MQRERNEAVVPVRPALIGSGLSNKGCKGGNLPESAKKCVFALNEVEADLR